MNGPVGTEDDDHLLLSSVLFALIAPPIGFLVSIVLFTRRETNAAWATLGAALAASFLFAAGAAFLP